MIRNKKNKNITFMLTEEQKKKLEKRAYEANLSMSMYVRMLLEKDFKRKQGL